MVERVSSGRRAIILREARARFARGERPGVAAIAAAAGVSRATFYRLVGSRAQLLKSLDVEPDPQAATRILTVALTLLGQHGLARLSMDRLAEAASVSRATLYRLFPGKAALFQALLRTYSPLEAVDEVMRRMYDRPPEEVMPAVVRAVYPVLAARIGIVRTLFLELSGMSPGSEEGAQTLRLLLSGVLGYLAAQMQAGRLRRMHPVLALQALVGPIFFHLMTRQLVDRMVGLDIPVDAAAEELVQAWLRAMRPEAV